MKLEKERLKTLKELDILNDESEKMLDNITEMASTLCKMPIAVVSLLDADTQFFKSRYGIDICETPIEYSLCKIAIEQNEKIFIIPDARKDVRFKENPLVLKYPNIVSYYGVPLRSKSGIAYGALALISNEVKILTEEQKDILIKFSKHIEYLIEWKSKRILIKEYQSKVESYSKDMEDFAYMAVHDLKAPVRAIDSFVKLLDKKHKNLWDTKDQEFISFIHQSVAKMKGLTNDLLAYCKSTINLLNDEKIDLNELIHEIFNSLTFDVHPKPILVCDKMPILYSSKIAFSVLFTNLINNALKYQDGNQIPKIQINTLKHKEYWIFNIADNGIGIESKYFDQIFKPLKRLHSNAKYQGNGLGLAICEKIVSKLNGEISVASVLEKGSTFTLRIPK
jgi:signal transduction histidine kinase